MCMLCDSKILVGKLLAIHIFDIWVNLNFFCPTKLRRNSYFVPQSYGAKQSLPANSFLNIMEQCRLCFAKL